MNNYYYLSSDQKMALGNCSIDFTNSEMDIIPRFDYPIQLEIFNGVEKDWGLKELMQYIQNHTAPFAVCNIQLANLLNSNLFELKVQKK